MDYKRKEEAEYIIYRQMIIEMVGKIEEDKFLRNIYILLKMHINRSN